ncbi:LRR_1 domain-containing protein/LRRNT_2 domain-containing protein/LRR_4 domain-containing protein/LRR_6 domain-containing protein/LRR_8 domain-containing protein, partial [Cephalotus follicularis]
DSTCILQVVQWQPLCHGDERSTLLQFVESYTINNSACLEASAYLNIASWKYEGESTECCSWDGIECDEDTGHVVSVDLSRSCLHGTIDPNSSLFRLVHLQWLSLAENSFTGPIPYSLGNLTNLNSLYLDSNNFFGPIPSSFSQLTQLTSLYIHYNQINGQIPVWIGNLTRLTEIFFYNNHLDGPVPESISQLVHIEYLFIDHNNLSGEVDFEYFFPKFKNLTHLDLSNNNLSVIFKPNINVTALPKFETLGLGSCNLNEFPYIIQNQDKLELLILSSNNLHGQIPESFCNSSKDTLTSLYLDANFLTGFDSFPVVLPWSNLQYLNLAKNILQGSLPIPQPSIISYNVSDNRLTGQVSPVFCNTTLQFLDLSNNSLDGMLPQCLGNISNSLLLLNLQNNFFYGDIIRTFVNGCKLRMINLSQNRLQGNIPRSLASCTNLEFLNLGNNQIYDTFPSWLGTLTEFKVLILGSNEFHGEIEEPKSEFDFPMLRIVDLSNNSFTGKLPSQQFEIWNAMKNFDADRLRYLGQDTSYTILNYFYWTMVITNKGTETYYGRVQEFLVAIDLSSNRFEGEIPGDIGNMKALRLLNLSNNVLIGHIPSSFENLTQLEALDLSQNNLSGEIPQQLSQLSFLSFLNVSQNNLTGSIPQGGQFYTFPNNSFEGNSGLCGDPLSKKCGTLPPPPSSTGEEGRSSSSLQEFGWRVVLMGYACGLVVGVFVGYIVMKRKPEWFMTTFGMRRQKMIGVKKRGCRR